MIDLAVRAPARMNPRHVDALNAIEVEFSKGGTGNKRVLDTWRLYLNHLNDNRWSSSDQLQRWGEKKLDLLIDLLHVMSRALQYDFDKVALRENCYAPLGHRELEMEQTRLRKCVIAITAGEHPLWITENQPDSAKHPPTGPIPPGEK